MNIIIMNNRASFLVSFWSVLISRLQEEGHQVTCLVPAGDSEAEATLKGFGASIRNYPLDKDVYKRQGICIRIQLSYMDIIKTPPLSVLKNKLSKVTGADVPFTKRP